MAVSCLDGKKERMNPLSAISESYKRWRHAKGFGVHSPFAYRLVKTVVAPDRIYGYYGYYAIDVSLPVSGKEGYPRLQKDARLLLRLLATLGIRRLLTYSSLPKAFEAAAEAAGTVVTLLSGTQPLYRHKDPESGKTLTSAHSEDLILLRGDEGDPDELKKRMQEYGSSVMALDPSERIRTSLSSFRQNGIRFSGKRIVIVIPNPDVTFVEYVIKM